ncbi:MULTISPECIES: glycosyltransferase [unclassified Carboxylicivirga]|uniref:glycosyltransferase n=1 Tax=Carboxylicivirga TaxID=1628153 RepID=UPI003D359810
MTNITLCLHTAQFPYGLGEQFIETEITYLAQAFERVVIIPGTAEGRPRPLPANVEVCVADYSGYTTAKGLQHAGSWMRHCLSDVRRSTNKKLTFSTLLRAGYQAQVLYTLLKRKQLLINTLHYAYWFNEQSTLLAILKQQHKINGFISRAHGFDLYEERNPMGFIPFRVFQLHYVSKLYLIAADGLHYMQQKYPAYAHKYQLSYLGVEHKHPFIAKARQDDTYTLVSCSRVVDIKRVHLIVEALAQVKDIPIRWVHFGDGPLLEEVKKLAKQLLPDNIEVEFKGQLPNTAIYEYYHQHIVDAFINVSSSEGLPVSIMEAVSYGIPVVATDVGGTSEIINPKSGVLLQASPAPKQIKDGLLQVFVGYQSPEKRRLVHEVWNLNFNAQRNYFGFAKLLKNLKIE